VQAEVADLWQRIDSDSLDELSDFAGYRQEFLRLFGFEVPGVDYDAEVDPVQPIRGLLEA
jgi:enoyl-[acyl-carrier protein] reductase/trans-2-enoyl-CoA reductase (NAD+)